MLSPSFSRRSNWQESVNRITTEREDRRRRGESLLDLTGSNPTMAGFRYPVDELSKAMGRAARAGYDPQPLGLPSAREAVAAELGCDAHDVVITASTSESYSFLFKLLTDPGDEIATVTPSYPLLEHLAAMELVSLRPTALELHRRWELHDVQRSDRTRAIALVSPNNPTGSWVRADERARVAAHGLPLIVDEVFRDYPLTDGSPSEPPSDVLTFSLGGLSKSAGLPHYKLGWIRLGGADPQKRAALQALELIADSFLSVSTPVQAALPELLRIGRGIRTQIHDRVWAGLEIVRAAVAERPSIALLPAEAGWSAVLRVPAVASDEELALRLLAAGVVVQPGYFFDFPADGFLVVSLLTDPQTLAAGMRVVVENVS